VPGLELIGEIEKAEVLLARLEAEHGQARTRLAALRAEQASQGQAEPGIRVHLPVGPAQPAPRNPQEKVRLFRRLFRGRGDVFPTRFVSKKTGKPGYAPACTNKFVRGVCELPKVKCGECPNQAFVPVDDAAVLSHLQGRHVMGVYPLLKDETSWFLAVDFDKSTWNEDVLAFMATCRQVGLPAAVERSRSGNGAHVWFFFNEPVPAVTARKMGCYLITETMARRHQLSMDSYDRLFPSQDTMPRGGFGNLIALPLQHGPRQQGNSVFLTTNSSHWPTTSSGLTWLPYRGSTAEQSRGSPGRLRARDRSSACARQNRLTRLTPNRGFAHPRKHHASFAARRCFRSE
jgi:hypothetical protein